MLLLSVQYDVIVLLCESSYCSMLNVVGEDMFMEVATRASDGSCGMSCLPGHFFQILNARQREHFLPLISVIGKERDLYLQHQSKGLRSGGQNIGYSWAS